LEEILGKSVSGYEKISVGIHTYIYENKFWAHEKLLVAVHNSTFERVEEFKYLGTTLTNKNSITEEIKSRLKSGNACYHSVQNFLSSRLLPKNLKIKISSSS